MCGHGRMLRGFAFHFWVLSRIKLRCTLFRKIFYACDISFKHFVKILRQSSILLCIHKMCWLSRTYIDNKNQMAQDVLKLKLLCNIVLILSNSYWVSYFKKLSISVSGFTSLKLHFNFFLSKWISKCYVHTHIQKMKIENFNMVTMKTKRYVKFNGSMQAWEIT